MEIEKPPEKLKKELEKHNQGHLLAFWDKLDAEGRGRLIAQIEYLDFSRIDQWSQFAAAGTAKAATGGNLEPPAYFPAVASGSEQAEKYEPARRLGRRLISEGKIAAFLVAGGVGTRLGFDGPKGDFPISPVRHKTLFRLFAEQIMAAGRKYGCKCRWYVMTSPANDTQTRRIFESNHYFGLPPGDVFIFVQGTMPAFNLQGRILLADRDRIARSPDGHGGSLKAVYSQGALDDMKEHGMEIISYFQVDNPLVNIFDPLFIGLHRMEGSRMSSKAVKKTDPKEKVGNFCLSNGAVAVIEYSDLPDELAVRRRKDGSLAFGLGSIAIHMIDVDFIAELNAGGFSLPLHRAVKKIPHVDGSGRFVEPEAPNGVKLESFVFDALPLAGSSIILETLRGEEFAPVKNAAGSDSPATSRDLMVERAAAWLESAEVAVPRKADGSADCVVEIAADFALEKDDVKAKKDRISPIGRGEKVYLE